MILRTVVRDCLQLNWAIPAELLPPCPQPLRYQVHAHGDLDWVLASVQLFHLDGVRLANLPLPRLSYPQCHLRISVLDRAGEPASLFRRILVPPWMVPVARLAARQPAVAARLEFPSPSRQSGAEEWCWTVRSRQGLRVCASRGAWSQGGGPRLGSWEETLRYFWERPRGFVETPRGLLPMTTARPAEAAWPMRPRLIEGGLVLEGLGIGPGVSSRAVRGGASPEVALPVIHSAWLCPESPLTFELLPDLATDLATLPGRVKVPGRSGVPAPGMSSGGCR